MRDQADPAESGGGGGGEGEVIAVVELTLRKPDGTLPTNWPFPVPWRSAVSFSTSGGGRETLDYHSTTAVYTTTVLQQYGSSNKAIGSAGSFELRQ